MNAETRSSKQSPAALGRRPVSLFDPLRLGALVLPNRILMAPMTRARGTRDHVPARA